MDLAALGVVIAALGGVVKLLLDSNDRREERFTAALETQQSRQEKFLDNHMSSQTRAQENVATALRNLTEEVRSGR